MATAITVVCPYCNNRMRASSEYLGRKGRCPACKKLVEIRVTGEESLVSIQPTAAAELGRPARARLGSTTVPGWKSGVIGAGVTGAVYLVIFLLLRGTPIGELFLDRGPMPYFITLVTCWGLAMLVMKYLAVKKQLSYAELELELIPLEIGVEITPENVDQFLEHLGGLPLVQRWSILGRRIQGALEHFKSRKSVPEVQDYLATQAEIDASGVDSGYTLLRAFIWAVPILGFIGTVMGISTAVSGLDKTIGRPDAAAVAQADDPAAQPADVPEETASESLMSGLGTVTAGLATAFDTTLIALVMAILLLFPTDSLRRIEYGMLDRIEAFANESLLRRMSDDRGPVSAEELPEVVRDALDSAFREHQRWLAQWQAQVGELGQLVGADFESAINRVQENVSQAEAGRLEKYQSLGLMLEDVFEKAERSMATWQESGHDSEAKSREFLSAVSQLQETLAENARLCNEISQEQSRMWKLYSDGSLGNTMMGLAEQIGKLADKLDGSGVSRRKPRAPAPVADEPPATLRKEAPEMLDVIEPTVDPPPSPPTQRSGLFGRFWGKRR